MKKDVFRKVQEQLDQYFVGMPATDSGVEIEILKDLFTESEAELFTYLTAELVSPKIIGKKSGKDVDETAEKLESMAKKGLAYRKRNADEFEYSAAPFMHGLIEFQLNRIEKPTAINTGKYLKKQMGENVSLTGGLFVRTVPVNQAIAAQLHVAPYDDGRLILQQEVVVELG